VYSPLELSRHREPSTEAQQPQGTRTAVRRMMELAQRRNLFLPIELMGIIFDYYVHFYGQLPEKLLLVCRTWYVLALSQPTLWTNIDPRGQFKLTVVKPWVGTFLQSRIARSNPAPLKVDFTNLRKDMTPNVAKKVAAIPTFLFRIQELVISRVLDMNFLAGDQPLLKSLTIFNYPPGEEIIAKLLGKKLTALRLRWVDKPPTLPDSLLQRLKTLEVTLPQNPEGLHEYWTMIKKSTTLHTLHISPTYGNAPALFHPTVQHLSIIYPAFQCKPIDSEYSLREVRMPRLQDIVIDTLQPEALMQLKLVETPVMSLHLKRRPPIWGAGATLDTSWVNSAVHLLRSTPALEKLEISASSSLVSGLLGAFEEDAGLCTELNVFLINDLAEMQNMRWDDKKNSKTIFAQLRGTVATFMNKRQSRRMAHSFSKCSQITHKRI